MKRLLIQTQLSNYTSDGIFTLECDSGWQMVMGRVRVMLTLDPELQIDVMTPLFHDCRTEPYHLNSDLVSKFGNRLRFIPHRILPNALATRYDFNFHGLAETIKVWTGDQRYDAVYVNDPMLLRNFRALFHVKFGYQPKFFTHSHFIDNPSCPKFPVEASLWHGQVEAAIRSDYNFWQCKSALDIFLWEMGRDYSKDLLEDVSEKSAPWDDGYSSEEINSPVNMMNLTFNPHEFLGASMGKVVLFVPNRIGDGKRSSDYTNCGKFMFEFLPRLKALRDDFIVVCGNPNQKISNDELDNLCGRNGYLKLTEGAFNRDEYKFVARNSHIVVSLYNADSYGGTSNRECIDLGLAPLMLDNYEYASIAKKAKYDVGLAKSDLSDLVEVTSRLIDQFKDGRSSSIQENVADLKNVVRERCSYEKTTEVALNTMNRIVSSNK